MGGGGRGSDSVVLALENEISFIEKKLASERFNRDGLQKDKASFDRGAGEARDGAGRARERQKDLLAKGQLLDSLITARDQAALKPAGQRGAEFVILADKVGGVSLLSGLELKPGADPSSLSSWDGVKRLVASDSGHVLVGQDSAVAGVDMSNFDPRVRDAARDALSARAPQQPFGSDVFRENKWGTRTLGDLVGRGTWEEGRNPVTLLHRARVRTADLEAFLPERALSDYDPTPDAPLGGHWRFERDGTTWDVTVKGRRSGSLTTEIYKVERGTKFWLDMRGMFVPERRLIPFEPRRFNGEHVGGSFIRRDASDVKMAQTTTQSPAVSVVVWAIPVAQDEASSDDLPPAHLPGDSDLTLFLPNKKPNLKNPRQKKSREPKKGNDGVDDTKPTEISFDRSGAHV
jgi:hypothetical protein